MKTNGATQLFAALAQETRLQIVRLLIAAVPDGMAAGEIADRLQVPAPTLSFHLNHLAGAGLILSQRAGRSIIYTVELDKVRALITFLVQDCCQGDPSLCGGFSCVPTTEAHVDAH